MILNEHFGLNMANMRIQVVTSILIFRWSIVQHAIVILLVGS